MSKFNLSLLAVLSCFLLACSGSMPKPASSEFIQTDFAGFGLNGEAGTVKYGVRYNVKKPFTKTVYYKVEFENPTNPSSPFVKKGRLSPYKSDFMVESFDFNSIKNNKNYKVVLSLYADQAHSNKISTHTDMVRFQTPSHIVKSMGIKLL